MSSGINTLFLRLAGPMQSWGTSSRFQLRRTDAYPSKSGVLGMILCAMGISRDHSADALERLRSLLMGVRVDRSGYLDWDYHTVGAKIGIRSADGKVKKTASTGEYETVVSHREYLNDASFLVALQGAADCISACADAITDPVWPLYLGRKSCVPGEPVFAGKGSFQNLSDALASATWRPRLFAIDLRDRSETLTLDTYTECAPVSPAPGGARLVYDVPRAFGFNSHGPRWVVAGRVTVPVGEETQEPVPKPIARRVDYASPQWKAARLRRLGRDNYLCVFCKSPAVEVPHVDYANVGRETDEDLRSLCKICHDACTILEYGQNMQRGRIDPSNPDLREIILGQIKRCLATRRLVRRRELLETGRVFGAKFFDEVPDSPIGEVD